MSNPTIITAETVILAAVDREIAKTGARWTDTYDFVSDVFTETVEGLTEAYGPEGAENAVVADWADNLGL